MGHTLGNTACAAKVMQQRLSLVRSDGLVLVATESLPPNNVEKLADIAEHSPAETKRKVRTLSEFSFKSPAGTASVQQDEVSEECCKE